MRSLTIRLGGKADELYTNSAASSVSRGPCIGRIIGLLSRGHALRYLTLEFENSDLLLAFMGQAGLTQALSDMRGIGKLRLWIPSVDEPKKKRLLQQAGLWETFLDLQKSAQRQPVPLQPAPARKPSEALTKGLLDVERTEQRAREMLAQAESYRSLLIEQEEYRVTLQQCRKTLEKAQKAHEFARIDLMVGQERVKTARKEAEAARSESERIEEEEAEEDSEEGDCIVVASRIA